MKSFQGQLMHQIKHLCYFLLISVIIILSGCVSPCTEPKIPLNEVMLRVADSQAEENVIHFIEFYDFRTFLGLNDTDRRILSDYDDSFTHAKFMQNISLILFNSRKQYVNGENLLTGDLFSYIACQNVTRRNYTHIDTIISEMIDHQYDSHRLFFNLASNIAAYLTSNSTQIIMEENSGNFNNYYNFTVLLSNNTEFDWYWIALVMIRYEWTCCSSTNSPGCYSGYLHSELLFLSPTFQILGVFAFYELHIA